MKSKLLASVLVLAGAALCQKTTLNDVDAIVKKTASEQAAALKQLAKTQAAGEASARARAVQAKDSSDLTQYKAEERMRSIENALARAAEEKTQAEQHQAAEERQSHAETMALGRQIFAGVLIAFLLGASKAVYSLMRDARAHRETARSLDQIHTLVNSSFTAALENELDARRSYVVLLRATIGAPANPDVLALIELQADKIRTLEKDLKNRLEQAVKADQKLREGMFGRS